MMTLDAFPLAHSYGHSNISLPLHSQLGLYSPPMHPSKPTLEEQFPWLEEDSNGKKRTRKLLTPEQSKVLHQILEKTYFPSTQVRAAVARDLGLTPRKVQIFFQNKRQKERRKTLTSHTRPSDAVLAQRVEETTNRPQRSQSLSLPKSTLPGIHQLGSNGAMLRRDLSSASLHPVARTTVPSSSPATIDHRSGTDATIRRASPRSPPSRKLHPGAGRFPLIANEAFALRRPMVEIAQPSRNQFTAPSSYKLGLASRTTSPYLPASAISLAPITEERSPRKRQEHLRLPSLSELRIDSGRPRPESFATRTDTQRRYTVSHVNVHVEPPTPHKRSPAQRVDLPLGATLSPTPFSLPPVREMEMQPRSRPSHLSSLVQPTNYYAQQCGALGLSQLHTRPPISTDREGSYSSSGCDEDERRGAAFPEPKSG